MILPIQHVPRYPLLLGRIRKVSDPNHEHYRILDIAYQFVKQLSAKMNQVEQEEERVVRFFEICTREVQNVPYY